MPVGNIDVDDAYSVNCRRQQTSVGALLVGIAVVTLIVLLSRDPLSRKVRSAAVWGVTMQAAAVVATINGLRGNWNVWRESSKPAGGG